MEFQQYSMRENNRREAQKPKIKQWLGGDVVIDGEPTNYFDGLIVRIFEFTLAADVGLTAR